MEDFYIFLFGSIVSVVVGAGLSAMIFANNQQEAAASESDHASSEQTV